MEKQPKKKSVVMLTPPTYDDGTEIFWFAPPPLGYLLNTPGNRNQDKKRGRK